MARFRRRDDTERYQAEVAGRLEPSGLKLHPDKTRLIEFERFARENRCRRKKRKPLTFDFLGFTHCCGKTHTGRLKVLMLTSAKRMRAKLQAVKLELRKRMQQPVAEQGQYRILLAQGPMLCMQRK